jgi:hypothetical protein
MVNIYNYQVWSTVDYRCNTSADAAYITTVRQPLRPSAGVFLYIINLFIN